MGLVYSRPTWEKVQRHLIEARRARERSQRTDEKAGLPGMSVNPRQGQGSHRLTGRWESCWGAGVAGLGRRFWLVCGSGARWQAPQEQLGGHQNKGARGCDVNFCQSQNRSQLVTVTTNTEPPWRCLQDARASGTQMQGPLALGSGPQTHRPAVVTGKQVFL